jgi:hypothetical protein
VSDLRIGTRRRHGNGQRSTRGSTKVLLCSHHTHFDLFIHMSDGSNTLGMSNEQKTASHLKSDGSNRGPDLEAALNDGRAPGVLSVTSIIYKNWGALSSALGESLRSLGAGYFRLHLPVRAILSSCVGSVCQVIALCVSQSTSFLLPSNHKVRSYIKVRPSIQPRRSLVIMSCSLVIHMSTAY